MYSFKRADRVREVIHKEVSTIIREDVKDPRIGFWTITAVEVSPKLQSARIFISPMGSEEERDNTFKGICSARKYIRAQLGKRLRLRYLPEIYFKIDTAPERSDKINRLLHKLEAGEPENIDPADSKEDQTDNES